MSAIPCLHLPVDFERRASVRLLARKMALIFDDRTAIDRALIYGIRIWLDWATAREEWRPLQRAHKDIEAIDWSKEDLTYIIENAAGWAVNPGDLMRAAIETGFITVALRDEKLGLLLDGFWELNEHFSPDFRSIQSRGGRARAEKRYESEAFDLATQRRKIFERQGVLPFGDEKPNELEAQLCYALFYRLHRVCNLDMPNAIDFSAEAMVDALNVIRKYTPDEISAVENYLIENRENPAVVKVPATILKNFSQYLDPARPA